MAFKSVFHLCGLVIFASSASASLLVMTGNNPEPSEENVLLNGISDPGTLVSGHTNQTNTLVNFTTTAINQIEADPNGQSFITGAVDEGVNGGTFSNLTISLVNGATFTDVIFALDLPGTGAKSACSQCISYSVTGSASGSADLPGTIGPGTTFFTFLATGGQTMSSITLSGVGGQSIEDVRQVRISGVASVNGGGGSVGGAAVPEPTPALLVGLGLAFLGVSVGLRRHRKTRRT